MTGIGLRSAYAEELLNTKPNLSFLEVHTENLFKSGGKDIDVVRKISHIYPLSFHGVGLSLGTPGKMDYEHLEKTKELVDEFKPILISEHLSWSRHKNIHTHDLISIPYNNEALGVFSKNVSTTQDFLKRQILIENPSHYFKFKTSTMEEPEFIDQLIRQTGCGLLLDVNNVYVSSQNLNFDPYKYIACINPLWVKEIHLAGHTRSNAHLLIDTHNDYVCDDVWKLYAFAIKLLGSRHTIVEWDSDFPALDKIIEESNKAQKIMDQYEIERNTENVG